MLSNFLRSRKDNCKKLIAILKETYSYVSILGTDVADLSISSDSRRTSIDNGISKETGFVIKVYNGKSYSEYSVDDISGDLNELTKQIKASITLTGDIANNTVAFKQMINDEPLVESFSREDTGKVYSNEEILAVIEDTKKAVMSRSDLFINCRCAYTKLDVSKIFISSNRDLEQFYTWTQFFCLPIARKESTIKYTYGGIEGLTTEECVKVFKEKALENADMAIKLLDAKPIEPGFYDIITAPSITGLIAHEAFGHGVEMDMFVKNRALAKEYVGKPVASKLVNMHDGALNKLNVASYFFDDDGILAHDTEIIKEGILITGISDNLSALQLGTNPTGNGRRESFKRKAYTRMTNTYFLPGTDKLEDMIASIKYGYMLFDTSNGMEDPKNWSIQCVASYGKEIVDGKFTGKIVSPVVMSGYVPDLLKSITMVSDEFELSGAGLCGKGYKEYVRVSDGGPCLKAQVKLG